MIAEFVGRALLPVAHIDGQECPSYFLVVANGHIANLCGLAPLRQKYKVRNAPVAARGAGSLRALDLALDPGDACLAQSRLHPVTHFGGEPLQFLLQDLDL